MTTARPSSTTWTGRGPAWPSTGPPSTPSYGRPFRPAGSPSATGTSGARSNARESDPRTVAEAVIARHERDGAGRSRRLPLAEELPRPGPVEVCSLSSETACRIALETHDLDGYVDAVAGRYSGGAYKPDPDRLLSVIAGLDADPATTPFVGDSETDCDAAAAAGVAFRCVEEHLEDRSVVTRRRPRDGARTRTPRAA